MLADDFSQIEYGDFSRLPRRRGLYFLDDIATAQEIEPRLVAQPDSSCAKASV